MPHSQQPLAIITGASSGIGHELARICAVEGFTLVIASDQPEIEEVAEELRRTGVEVTAVKADLSTIEGVDQIHAAVGGRAVDALFANAGTAVGHAFLDEDPARIRHVIDTNITGTVYLVHRIGTGMRARNRGHILLTGSIAGFLPGAYMAVYNGTKAFINSFAFALREELRDTEVSVTVLMPGATETDIFNQADMQDTAVGRMPKDDPAMVARAGFNAMMTGKGDVAAGLKNKILTSLANVTPSGVLAAAHRKAAQPGSEKS